MSAADHIESSLPAASVPTQSAATEPVVRPVDQPATPRPTLEVNLALYAALVGKTPEIVPNADPVPTYVDPEQRPQRHWSPTVFSLYLRDAYRQRAMRLSKPEIAAWIRRQSDSAKKRISESQQRLTTSRESDRAA